MNLGSARSDTISHMKEKIAARWNPFGRLIDTDFVQRRRFLPLRIGAPRFNKGTVERVWSDDDTSKAQVWPVRGLFDYSDQVSLQQSFS